MEDLEKRRARHRRYWETLQARADALRAALIAELGGRCARCEGDETYPLTIDHVGGGRTWDLHALNPYRRVLRYVEEHRAGVPLRVLCLQCNSEERNTRALPPAPF